MRFDAIAFDLDGTLYPASRLFLLALPRMLRMPLRLAAFDRVRRELRSRAQAAPGTGADRPFRIRQAELFAEELGIALPEAEAFLEENFYRGPEELFARIRPYAGALRALDALKGAGLRLALLSDQPPKRKLELMGLSGRFETLLCSEDTGFLKPAGEPFAALAGGLGLAPGRILYVGNSPRYDLVGAKAAGMASAIVTRRCSLPGADLAFWDWRKLVEFATSQ
jgi:putative hydrolase of the HAD superfamily